MDFEELNELFLNDFDTFETELLYAFGNTIDEDKLVLLMDIIEHWYDSRFVDSGLAKKLRKLI